jgi:hypothetical protein
VSLHHQQQEAPSYPNRNNNLNETFVKEEDVNLSFTTNEGSPNDLSTTVILGPSSTTYTPNPNRQVSRHDSYIIPKSSSKLNSNDTKPHDLNSTFVRANHDGSSPSEHIISDSHNLSMEELHVMARRQEQCEFISLFFGFIEIEFYKMFLICFFKF